MNTSKYDGVIRSYGSDIFKLIQSSSLLVVGAGGIGCEVTNLVILVHYLSQTSIMNSF